MSRLVPCPDCKRHVRAASTSCPHCGRSSGALTFAAITMTAGLALAGCDRPVAAVYGPPPQDPTARIPTPEPTATEAPTATATETPTAAATETPSAAPTSTATATAASTAAAKPTATSLGTVATPIGTGRGPSAAYGPPPRKPKDRMP